MFPIIQFLCYLFLFNKINILKQYRVKFKIIYNYKTRDIILEL